jgi:hypothetical protein
LSASNLAMSLWGQGKPMQAAEILQAVLASRRRTLGSAHPDTLATVKYLESVRSPVHAKEPVRSNARAKGQTSAAQRSPTELAEAEARARAAEAELLAMLELEDRKRAVEPNLRARQKR